MTARPHQPATSLLAAMVFCSLLAAGCQQQGLDLRAGPSTPLPKDENSAAFLDRVADAENVSEHDAFRGMLLLLDGNDEKTSFGERVRELHERGLVDSTWSFQADRPISRGKLAYMVYQATGIPGGVVLTLTGPSQRYCLKELQYRRVMVDGAVYSPVSGLEFVSVLNRADVYRRTGKVPDMTGSVAE